jgi:hypothetical protein
VNERLTRAEIEERFPEQWILLDDFPAEPSHPVSGGVVRWRSKSREEVYRKATALGLKRIAVLFTGKPTPPEGVAIAINLGLPFLLAQGLSAETPRSQSSDDPRL